MCLAVSKPIPVLEQVIVTVCDSKEIGGGRFRVLNGWMKKGEEA
jgi:hypothetical protein